MLANGGRVHPHKPDGGGEHPQDEVVQKMRIDEFEVDVLRREIASPYLATPVRITPKAMAVLLLLAQGNGRPVTRSALMAAAWAGTMPTEDVLTQAVTVLRKAMSRPGGQESCIETIVKSGYRLRLRSPVGSEAAGQTAQKPQSTRLAPGRGIRRIVATAILLLAALALRASS